MKQLLWAASLVWSGLGGEGAGEAVEDLGPDVVLTLSLSDDHRRDASGASGNDRIPTLQLDRLVPAERSAAPEEVSRGRE